MGILRRNTVLSAETTCFRRRFADFASCQEVNADTGNFLVQAGEARRAKKKKREESTRRKEKERKGGKEPAILLQSALAPPSPSHAKQTTCTMTIRLLLHPSAPQLLIAEVRLLPSPLADSLAYAGRPGVFLQATQLHQ